jgi:PAS domain S-box-containing protein
MAGMKHLGNTVLVAFLIIPGILLVLLMWGLYGTYNSMQSALTQDLRMEELQGQILYLDEVLTMSARMGASTGDLEWEKRYNIFEPQLVAVLKEAVDIEIRKPSHVPDTHDLSLIDTSNDKLVAMERKAFDLIRQGHGQEAQSVLAGKEYEHQKQIYAEGTHHLLGHIRGHISKEKGVLASRFISSVLSIIVLMPLWILVVSYIYQRKQAERELIRTNEQLAFLLENLPTVIYTCKAEGDFGATYVSQNIEQVTGYRSSEFIRNSAFWSERIHPDDRPGVFEKFAKLNDLGQLECEYRFKVSDGTYRWFMDTIRLVKSQLGSKNYCIGIWQDITHRKGIEIELEENKQHLSALISNLPGVAYRCKNDKDYTLEYISEACVELYGYQPSDLLNNNPARVEMVHPEDQEQLRNIFQTALSINKPFQSVYRITTALGKEKWVWEQGRGVFSSDGNLLTLEGFVIDITAQKQDQIALTQAKVRLAQLSHHVLQIQEDQYRTVSRELHDNMGPTINAVRLGLERMERDAALWANEALSKYRQDIHDSVSQLRELSKGVRDLSKQMRSEVLDELGLINALESYTDNFQRRTDIQTEFRVCSTKLTISGNVQTHLYRIVQEALNNISKHAQASHVVVEIAKDKKQLVLSILDNGNGFHFDKLGNEENGLPGIGLTNIQERANLIKGKADIISGPGNGTKIIVRVPLHSTQAS